MAYLADPPSLYAQARTVQNVWVDWGGNYPYFYDTRIAREPRCPRRRGAGCGLTGPAPCFREATMLRYLFKRALLAIPTMFAVSVLVFVILHLVPGDPAAIFIGDRPATPERLAQIRHVMGLDRPLLVQYGDFLWRLGRGDLGRSIHTHTSVLPQLLTPVGATAGARPHPFSGPLLARPGGGPLS